MIKIKILFITSQYMQPDRGSNIYTDLAEALHEKGHIVKVAVAEEKKKISKTTLFKENNIDVLRIKVGNLYEVSLVEKALTFLSLSRKLKKGIKEYWNKEKFDLILFQSPPLTMCSTAKWAMKKYHAKSYLMMKDIFPQNGVDIGLYSKKSPIYLYFRLKEKQLYKISTKIGCMSQGNIEYLLKHNKYLDKSKLELFPNTLKILPKENMTQNIKKKVRKKYGINDNDIVAVFGGNFGRPQGLDFLLQIIDEYKNDKKVKFLLIGNGTEKDKVFNYIKDNNYKNAITYDFVPRDEYENLIRACDIGLIFLDKRFTIPNYPSKILTYFDCSLPIMASIDKNTDFSKLLIDENCGFWVENGDIIDFRKHFDKLLNDEKLRKEMGNNGYNYLINNWDVQNSVLILERFVGEKNV